MSDKLPSDLASIFAELKQRNAARDQRHKDVANARRGNVAEVMPGVFPPSWPKPIVANVIDTTARDLARVLARMPAVDCSTGNSTSEKAKIAAAKRTKIALSYLDQARVKKQLYTGADWYFTFGAMPVVVEPDFEYNRPMPRFDDPRGAYWQTDAFGNVRYYCKTWQESIGSLIGRFPEHKAALEGGLNKSTQGPAYEAQQVQVDLTAKVTVGRLYTRKGTYLFVPDRGNLLLKAAPQPLNRVPVEIAELPSWDSENRGHFDDVMWVWLARARMALYGMEAADKSIRAPLAVPNDVQRIPLGPDALIRSNEAEKIRRVPLELPQAALIESQLLQQEVAQGTSYPSARSGQLDASIITGKGVEALSGVFSTQIAAAQDDVGDCLRRVLEVCFEMDEKFWPSMEKTARGNSNGAPFEEKYTPARDIKGDYSVSVTYGFTAGMDPNRALVFLLQLRGDRAIDRDTLQRQLPFETDTVALNQSIDIEEMEDALKQGVYGAASQISMMAQSGMDPTQLLLQIAQIVKDRKKGKAMYEAVLEALQPPEQPAGPALPGAETLGGAGGDPGVDGGPLAMEEGAAPSLQMMLAGLTGSGQPNLAATVSRRLPA